MNGSQSQSKSPHRAFEADALSRALNADGRRPGKVKRMEPNRSVGTGSRSVTVEARPERVTIDTARSAALVVDMQNDFGAKGGMFDHAGIDISITRSAIEPTKRTLTAVRTAGIPVFGVVRVFLVKTSKITS
jgi:hypothetical protein